MPVKEGIMAKAILKYKNGQRPDNLGEILGNADENDLRILTAILMSASEEGEIIEEEALAELLGLEQSVISASLKFWRGAGIIGGARASGRAKKTADKPEEAAKKSEKEYAHRGGAVESADNMPMYRSAELAEILERRIVSAQFVDEAQRVAGRTFNSYDTSIIVGIVDRLGFDEEAVLAILAYVRRIGKKGVKYSEKVAMGFYDDGITRTADVVERINLIERSSEIIAKIKKLFGIGARELSRTEKSLFEKWTQKFGYDIDVIRFAYEITIDAIHEPVPKYTNSILEKWHSENLRTLDDIKRREEENRAKKNGADTAKSYDLDDFFEAALQRSYEDLK